MDASETDDESLVGDIAHIVAENPDGPRGASPLPLEERNKYRNLILLCKVHHKLVDDQPATYTVELLHEMKNRHEHNVRSALTPLDISRQRDNEIYASYIEEWERLCHIDSWEGWTSWMLTADQPAMHESISESLNKARQYIFKRIWSDRYKGLEDSFENFRRVLQDLLNQFERQADKVGDWLRTRKFYQISEWNPPLYNELSKQYEDHVHLVEDLVLELTRGANYICDMVRVYLDPTYRIKDGLLVVTSGPYIDFTYRTHRALYRGEEKKGIPYPGIEGFKTIRFSRDYFFGEKEVTDA